MNAVPQSAFRLSLLREPTARTGTNRFSVRATSRTLFSFKLSKINCAHCERKVGREVLEPSSAVLQTAADQRFASVPASQLPAQVVVWARKNPVSLALVTPGSK